VFGADPARARVYHGNSTDQKGMLRLRENSPVTVEPLDEFLRGERHELVVFDSRSSILKAYLSNSPEYAGRLHLVKEDETYAILRLDPAVAADAP
jgi:hypothetical protein